jgi:hypothetical protein
MRLFLITSGLCAAGALVAASAGLASQPVTQTLNPPPPSFETCKAVGDGTICEGTVSDESYGPVETGLVCGSGASAFDIFDGGVHNEVAKRTYDANGDLVSRVRHDRTIGQLSTATGASLPYTQSQESTDALSIPGDFGSSTLTITGEMVLHGPGSPVLIGAGRIVFAPDGMLDFQAGPSGFLDLIFGDASAVGPICRALGGA